MSRQKLLLLFTTIAIGCVGVFAVRWFTEYRVQQRDASMTQQCREAVKDKDWDRLKRVANEWLNVRPNHNDALVFLSEAAVQLDDVELAVDSLGRVSDDYRGALQALSVRADLLFADANRPLEAEATWQRMLTINKSVTIAHQRLIYFYAMTLQRRRMVDAIYRAMEVGAEPPEAYSYLLLANSLNFSDGVKHVTRWRRGAPDNEVFEIAQALYVAKNGSDNSIATFGADVVTPGDQSLVKSCLAKYPGSVEILAFELDVAIFDGDLERVTMLLKNAPPEAAEDGRFWDARGWLLEQQGQLDEAVAALEKSLQLDPFRWQSRWRLSEVYRKLQRSEEAQAMSQVAIIGKDLQRALFEQPNARSLTDELVGRIFDYIELVGDERILSALSKRM